MPLHFRQHVVQAFRYFGLRAFGAELVSEACHETAQAFELFGVRDIVDAVGQDLGVLSLRDDGHAFRHGTVGDEHEFLHQFVGVACHLDVGADGVPLFVNLEAHLRTVESDGPGLEAFRPELFGKAVEDEDLACPFALRLFETTVHLRMVAGLRQVFGRCLAVAFDDFLGLLVGEAAVGADDGAGDATVQDVAFGVEGEDDGEGEFLLVGAQ